jgi:hypothetical protein
MATASSGQDQACESRKSLAMLTLIEVRRHLPTGYHQLPAREEDFTMTIIMNLHMLKTFYLGDATLEMNITVRCIMVQFLHNTRTDRYETGMLASAVIGKASEHKSHYKKLR